MFIRPNAFGTSFFAACFVVMAAVAGTAGAQDNHAITILPESEVGQEQTNALDRLKQEPTTGSAVVVRFNPQVLRHSRVLPLALPDEPPFEVSGEAKFVRSEFDYAWVGEATSNAGSTILTVKDDEVAGFIQNGIDTFNIRPIGNGLHALVRINRSKIPPDHHGQLEPRGREPSTDQGEEHEAALAQIDVFVAYTTAARLAYGGNMAILIQLAIDSANAAYVNSNANTALRLVGTLEVDYTEPALQRQALVDLTNGAGALSPLSSRREATSADLVSLITNVSDECGRAYPVANAENPFSVVNWNCISVGNQSFAHEIGHNIGADHDPANQSIGFAPYAHGYIYGTAWRTIMALPGPCNDCPRISNFSNPAVRYQGVPTGTPSTHDNARVHRERGPVVADFRPLVPALVVTPFSGGTFTGEQGGAFSPTSFSFRVASTFGTLRYSISGLPGWLTATSTSGTTGTSGTTINIATGGIAPFLGPGTYGPATVAFNNDSNGKGSTGRAFTLVVSVPPPAMRVFNPDLRSIGPVGGPFTPDGQQYLLLASSGTLNYSITGVPSWLTASSTSGAITTSPTYVAISLSSSAKTLAPGTYGPIDILFTNTTNGRGNAKRAATLVVYSSDTPRLVVTPNSGSSFKGAVGGPFSPAAFEYKLNGTTGTVRYSITGLPLWLSVSAVTGTAPPSGTVVAFATNSNANNLGPGAYGATVKIVNTETGLGDQSRVSMLVTGSPLFSLLDNPPGYERSVPTGISADGRVVAGYSCPPYPCVPTRWVEGNPTLLKLPEGQIEGVAYGANADGSIILGRTTGRGTSATVTWIDGNVSAVFFKQELQTGVISADGSTIAGTDPPFSWKLTGGKISLPYLTGYEQGANVRGISANGTIVVGDTGKHVGNGIWEYQAVRWTVGATAAAKGLKFLTGHNYSRAGAVSADGAIIAGSSFSNDGARPARGFRWADDIMTDIGDICPLAMTSDGKVIYGYGWTGTGALRWKESGGLRTIASLLDALGFKLRDVHLQSVTTVSATGEVIAGTGFAGASPPFQEIAWIVRMPAEP